MVPESDRDAPSPWHAGEREIQTRLGVADRTAEIGRRVIRNFMPDQHRAFFAQLPFLVVGSVDRAGAPWASIVAGAPGFATSPDPRLLRIAAPPAPSDPLAEAIVPGAALGLLGIELPTRRRNRMNGRVVAAEATGFAVAVAQSFGNCAQYIATRDYAAPAGHAASTVMAESFTALDDAARALVGRAETCFVASAAAGGVDVAHRGGRPGFLRLAADGAIVVPDYAGNRFFNTLGNLLVNPRAGLLFIDFDRGDLLQITGTTEIIWEGMAIAGFDGAERLWRLMPSHGRWLRGAMGPVRFLPRPVETAPTG